VVNNGTNTCRLTSANISISPCVIHLNTLLPSILCLKGKLLSIFLKNVHYYFTYILNMW